MVIAGRRPSRQLDVGVAQAIASPDYPEIPRVQASGCDAVVCRCGTFPGGGESRPTHLGLERYTGAPEDSVVVLGVERFASIRLGC